MLDSRPSSSVGSVWFHSSPLMYWPEILMPKSSFTRTADLSEPWKVERSPLPIVTVVP